MRDINLFGYYEHIDAYNRIYEIAGNMMKEALSKSGINLMQVTGRVKTAESVSGKLQRKPESYSSVYDMTDIVGFRIICYFSDKVDEIGDILRNLFVMDENNSVDKRNILAPNTFGYLSLHYIFSLPKSADYDDSLTKYRFEVQIRTVLQHTWAEIEHDLGYKTEFGVPRQVRREFSRMASLLEVADEGFLRIKEELREYTQSVILKLSSGDVADIAIDSISLREFIKYNDDFVGFTSDIASISNARLIKVSAENYIKPLERIGAVYLSDLLVLLEEQKEHAMLMAESLLKDSEIDEVASTVGLYFLCRARLVWGNYSENDISEYFALTTKDTKRIDRNTSRILSLRKRYLE